MRTSFYKSVKFHKSILYILALYLGTSIVLLGVICFVMYHKGLQNLKANQMAQMRNDYIQIATIIYTHKSVQAAKNELESAIDTPFAIIDSSGEVVFSTIADDLSAIIRALKKDRIVRVGEKLFVDHRFLRHIPPPKHPPHSKEIFRYIDSLYSRVILQGYEMKDTFSLPFSAKLDGAQLDMPLDIPKEVRKLGIEILLYFAGSIVLLGTIAYWLTRLALAPIYEKKSKRLNASSKTPHTRSTPHLA